jgi:ABC-type multidrug transport system fused ATPase/permease subunit
MSAAPRLFADGRGRRFALVAGLALCHAAAAAGVAVATRALFARWHDGRDPDGAALALAAAAAAAALAGAATRIAAEDLGQRYAASVRRAVFAHLAATPLAAVETRRAAGLTLRFTGDLAALSGWAGRGAARALAAAAALPPLLAALVWISPAAAAGAAGPLALGAAAMAVAGPRLAAAHRALRRRRARLASRMGERLRLAPLLRLVGRMPGEQARLEAGGAVLRAAALRRARSRALMRAIPDVAGGVAGAGAALAAWRAGAAAADLAGAFAALALALAQLRALAAALDAREASRAARDRLDALLRAPRAPRPGRARPREGRAALRFDAVSAGSIDAFSARLRVGGKAALTGGAGAGKSLLLRLAAGLASPETGRVLVAGADPRALGRRDRAAAVIHLGPETPILAGSLRRALSFGARTRPGDDALAAVAARVGLGPALDRLGGLDGAVAEGGRNLSDGERAMVALARLALAPEPLALVDGVDAHLDEGGRRVLAELLADRPGAVLCAPRHPDVAERLPIRWAI